MIEMTTERAVKIVKDVAAARERWGKYAYPPYSQAELVDALVVLHREGRFDAPSDEDITKLRRQLAAAEARVAKLSKRETLTLGERRPADIGGKASD